MSFSNKVKKTSDIDACYKTGLQAIKGGDREKFRFKNPRLIDGSVDIDHCVQAMYSQENRWDYVFGYDEKVFFVEIHPADTSQVSVMKRKLDWLRGWLQIQSSPLMQNATYHWVASGAVNITKNSSQARQLATMGIDGPKRMCECK